MFPAVAGRFVDLLVGEPPPSIAPQPQPADGTAPAAGGTLQEIVGWVLLRAELRLQLLELDLALGGAAEGGPSRRKSVSLCNHASLALVTPKVQHGAPY